VRYAAAALAGWTALTGLALLAEQWRAREAVREAAQLEAELSIELIKIVRRWNAGHGGVFVPVTPRLAPNPYLAHVPDREARTGAGRELTLMNPAWMTREILELANAELRVTGHITSLRPIRPENAPDPWERRALEKLEAGAASFGELVVEGGERRYRLMGALRVEERCLGCHGVQGYAVGDLRGGIAVAVPTAAFSEIGRSDVRRQAVVHGSIWLLGVAAILVALGDHRRRAAAEREAERRHQEAEAELAAARRLEAVGRLSAGIAHDFNNLLAPILTVSGVVRDELPGDSPLRADLDDIRAAATKARDLVRALQTLSQQDGARLERFPLRSVLVDGEGLLRSFAGRRLGFELRLADQVPVVVADRALVELALANLVVNAREGAVVGKRIAVEAGTVEIGRADAARLRVREGRHAAVTVAEADVPAALHDDLGAFAPVHGAGAADAGGAGVGMPTINGIVAQYGGGVVARPVGEAGWMVRLLLPEAPLTVTPGE
jgi:nitrogen-specific signal transduction histidine kinase